MKIDANQHAGELSFALGRVVLQKAGTRHYKRKEFNSYRSIHKVRSVYQVIIVSVSLHVKIGVENEKILRSYLKRLIKIEMHVYNMLLMYGLLSA